MNSLTEQLSPYQLNHSTKCHVFSHFLNASRGGDPKTTLGRFAWKPLQRGEEPALLQGWSLGKIKGFWAVSICNDRKLAKSSDSQYLHLWLSISLKWGGCDKSYQWPRHTSKSSVCIWMATGIISPLYPQSPLLMGFALPWEPISRGIKWALC